MSYMKGKDRNQVVMQTLDELVGSDSIARVIDEFVNGLDLKEFGYDEEENVGRPLYSPKDMIKLYIYGYVNNVCTSRRLEECCSVNVEVMWMLDMLKPNFHTISEFRKKNFELLNSVFRLFNKMVCSDDELFSKVSSAYDEAHLDDHSERYLRVLKDTDKKTEDRDRNGEKTHFVGIEMDENYVDSRFPSTDSLSDGDVVKGEEGCFVRDARQNVVVCPAGRILRQKSVKNDGRIRYVNKTACSHCELAIKCIEGCGKWKEVDFAPGQTVKVCRGLQ